MTPAVLAAAGAGMLGCVLGGTALLLAHDGRRRRLGLRIGEWVTPLAPARPPAPSFVDTLGLRDLREALALRLGVVCGYKRERRDAYPLAIWQLLVIAVIPAVVIERLGGRLLGLTLDPALPVLWCGCAQVMFRAFHARHADTLYRQFPDVLSMIVRSVRAGIPLYEALRVVSRESLEPTARQFTRVCDQMAIGMRLDEALRETTARTGVAEYGFFTVALTLQAQTGGSLADTLDGLADVIRKRVALRLRAVALASEARTSAYVLAALPVIAGLALALLNYEYIRPLFATPRGNRVLFAAIALLCTAGVVMRTMIQRSLR